MNALIGKLSVLAVLGLGISASPPAHALITAHRPVSTLATEVAPGVSLQQWNSLVAYNLKQGPPVERTRGHYITMTQMVPADPTRSHHSEYFSTVGNFDGVDFTPMEVLQVSETWNLNQEGNWEIEQWFFNVDLNGNIMSENHIKLVETPNHEILEDEIIRNGGAKDPVVLQ